jgi:ketosteroid isomerase-like protein
LVLPPPPAGFKLEPLHVQPPSPEVLELIKLEEEFATEVEKGGGPAFARWFADDGVTLSNGQAPVIGREAIARSATWRPDRYKLTWFVEGAGMGEAKDAAYTWGHYDTETTPAAGGTPVTHSGRYVTFWKKVNGHWKVALEASAEEPPGGAVLPAGPPDSVPAGQTITPNPK